MQGKFGNSMVNAFDIIVLFIPCFRVLVFGIWSLWLCDFISVFFVLPILHCPFSNVCNFVAKSDKKPEKKIGWIKHRIIFLQLMRDWNIRSEKKCTRKVYIKTQQVYSGYKKRREKKMFSNLFRLTKIKALNPHSFKDETCLWEYKSYRLEFLIWDKNKSYFRPCSKKYNQEFCHKNCENIFKE